MLQIQVLSIPGRSLRLPTRIKSLRIDPLVHQDRVIQIDSERQGRVSQLYNIE
jgi:fatty acid synthase